MRALTQTAAEMLRAAHIAEKDAHRPVTPFDARRWAQELVICAAPLDTANRLAHEMQVAARMSPRKCRRHLRRVLREEFAGAVIV